MATTEQKDGDAAETPQPKWRVESFYFGNAMTPSDRTYRRSGERLQVREEMAIPLTRYQARTYRTSIDYRPEWRDESVLDFLNRYQDCELEVSDGYEDMRAYMEPGLFVLGWNEVTSNEGRNQYVKDKLDGAYYSGFAEEEIKEILAAAQTFTNPNDAHVTVLHLRRLSEIVKDDELKRKIDSVIETLTRFIPHDPKSI